jgi:hypothetical protein
MIEESKKNRQHLLEFKVKLDKPLDTEQVALEEPIPKTFQGKKSRWAVPLYITVDYSFITALIHTATLSKLHLIRIVSLSRFHRSCRKT